MPTAAISRDISGRLLFLGTGTSHGVPVIGCGCDVCTSANPKNKRNRCSVLLGLPEGNLLIDTTPDLRTQLLREQIGHIDAVAYTHEHADHLFGLDDLRMFACYLGHDLPVYCNALVEDRIRQSFDYVFDPATRHFPAGGVPRLEIKQIANQPFTTLGVEVTPIAMGHGRFDVLGFRVGNVAYCTDCNEIPPESLVRLEGLELLVLGALRHRPHFNHFTLDEAVAMAQQVGARRTLFTHMTHELEHEATNATLPPGMALAYDGLEVPLG